MSRKDVGRTQRLVSDLLDREWDPIGVSRLPAADQPPGGEFHIYAGWVTGALYSGGGVEEIVRCLQRARDSMGLEAPLTLDEPVARLILERWQADA